ncbi:DUF4222 domain-containing protein [Enterobacter sp. RCC_40]|uniref:DUF4222 domain-containing protein n=1 Tax=Enterobacter TaxID=547 RepID=UPI003524B1E0
MADAITTEDRFKPLDIDYRDPLGVIVHITDWNRGKQQVFSLCRAISMCVQPVWKFQQYFRRVEE